MLEWLVVLAVPVAFVALIGGLVVRGERQTRAFLDALGAAGHRVTRDPKGYTIDGGDTVPWQLVQRTSAGKNSSTQVIWSTPAEPGHRVVLALPGPAAAIPEGLFANALVQAILQRFLGEEAAHLAQIRPVPVGGEAFLGRFSVLSDDEAAAAAFLTPAVQEALLHTSVKEVGVLRWRDRLELRVGRGLTQVDDVQALVALGETLAQAVGHGPE